MSAIETATARERTNDVFIVLVWIAADIEVNAAVIVNEIEKTAKKLTLMELTERTCKWPIGDPATEQFWFCGLPVQQGKPYCEAHVGVAFQPMSSRRDRRR